MKKFISFILFFILLSFKAFPQQFIIVGPQNDCANGISKNVHKDSKDFDIDGYAKLKITTTQHRTFDNSKIFDVVSDKLLWEWKGESFDATWYTKEHFIEVNTKKIRIEFTQGFKDPFCNGYIKVEKISTDNQGNSHDIIYNKDLTNSENITIQNYKSAQIRLRDKSIDGTINNIDQYAFIRHDYNNNQIEISTKYDHYKGGFINGKKNGIAIYESKGNFVYEGEFKDNEITGNGLMTFPGDETYKGGFINGDRNGKGIFIWKSGISYNGGWKNGLSHGYGLQTNPDGSKLYEGAYYKGQYHGFGVLYTANGSRTGGIWQTGNLLYSLPEFVNNPKFYDFDIEYGYTSFDFDVFCVSFNSKKGVINIKGKEIIPCKYDVFEFNTVGYEKRIVGRIFSSDLKDVYDYNGNYFGNKSHNADIEKVNRQREITANKIKSQEKLSSKSSANSELNPALMSLLASAVFLGGETERSKSASRTSSGSSNSNSNSQKVCSSCKPSDDKGWYITDYVNSRFINGRYIKRPGNKPCSRCHGTANCKAYNTCSSVFNNESNSCLQCKGDRFTECDWCKGTGYER